MVNRISHLREQVTVCYLEPSDIMGGCFMPDRIIRLDVYVPDRSVERRRVVRDLVPVNRPVRVVVHRKDLRMGVLPTVVDTEKAHQVTL